MLPAYAVLASESLKYAANTTHIPEARAFGELALWVAGHVDAPGPAYDPQAALAAIAKAAGAYITARVAWIQGGGAKGQFAMDSAADAFNFVLGQQRKALATALGVMV